MSNDYFDSIKDFPVTPLTEMVYESAEDKKVAIAYHFEKIMRILGLDMEDDSLKGTPKRVAKMYVDEIFKGLRKETFPRIMCVENKFNSQMVTEANITMNSGCEHHFITVCGYAHIAYIPKKKVIGLSKLNRIVDYFASRPQVQERLNEQIKTFLCDVMDTEDVAVVIDGVHFCVRARGIKDSSSVTRTASLGGIFKEKAEVRAEFFNNIPKLEDFKL